MSANGRLRAPPHIGTGMPKQPKTGLIVGIALVAALTFGVAAVWQAGFGGAWLAASSTTADASDLGRRQNELQFLKRAFDRVEAEAKQNPSSPALRSLRTEQNAILERMREVARPVPPERLSNELRALLGAEPATIAAGVAEKALKNEPRPAVPSAIAPAAPALGAGPAGELKSGLASAAPAPPLVLSRDPALSGVVLIARPRPVAEALPERPGERQPSSVNANGDAKPPAKPQITMRSPEKTAPSGASGATGRPGFEPVAVLGR